MAKNAGDLLKEYVDNPKQAAKDEVHALMEIVSVDTDPTPEAKWKQTGKLHLKLIEAVGGKLPPDIAVRFYKRHAEGEDAWTWDYVILVPGKRILGFFNRWDGKWAVRQDGMTNVINNPDKIAEDLIKKVQPLFKTPLLYPKDKNAEQDGGGQPATRPVSK